MYTQLSQIESALKKYCLQNRFPYPKKVTLIKRILSANLRYLREFQNKTPSTPHTTHKKRRRTELKRFQRAWIRMNPDTKRELSIIGRYVGCDVEKSFDRMIQTFFAVEKKKPKKPIDEPKRNFLRSLYMIFESITGRRPSSVEDGLFDRFCRDVCGAHGFGVKARRGAIHDGCLRISNEKKC